VTFEESGLWLGTRAGAGGIAILTQSFLTAWTAANVSYDY
jgi:hypothetical protein